MARKKARKPNKPYDLEACNRNHDFRILACDPGTRNFGISCVGVRKGRIDVIANSLFTNPITQLTSGFMAQRKAFVDEFRMWLDLYKPHAIVAERFQTRGNGGPTIELVSTMNALMGAMASKLPIKYVVASQWKNAFNKRFGDQCLNGLYPDCLTTPHQLDAVLIGCYALEIGLRQELIYSPASIVSMVESTSRLDLRRPRK